MAIAASEPYAARAVGIARASHSAARSKILTTFETVIFPTAMGSLYDVANAAHTMLESTLPSSTPSA